MCGNPYPSGRRRLSTRKSSAKGDLETCADLICCSCVERLAREFSMTETDQVVWFDGSGTWGTCKHYKLPGFWEYGEPDLDTPPVKHKAPKQQPPQVGLLHAFAKVEFHGEPMVYFLLRPKSPKGLKPRRAMKPTPAVSRCDVRLSAFKNKPRPPFRGPATSSEATC